MKKKRAKKKFSIEYRLEEILLLFLIFLNIIDFFEIIPGDLDYAKKIISWSALGFLLYKAGLTRIFFNEQHKIMDLMIIISYFFMITKNLVTYSAVALEEFNIFYGLNKLIIENSSEIVSNSFIIGGILLILISLYYALFGKIKKPSMVYAFYPKIHSTHFITRFIIVFLSLVIFFVIVFNLVMEWLAIAVDAPLIMIGIVFYFFILIRHYQNLNIDSLIFKIGNFAENFYEKFLSLFHYKKTLFLGITGMLVLHLLTEVGNFLMPYLFGFHDALYFNQLGPGHSPLITLFLEQSKTLPLVETLSLFLIYLLNLIGLLFLLIIPAYLWYVMYKQKKFHLNTSLLSLLFTSLLAFILCPVFEFKLIKKQMIVGVDILTNYASNPFWASFTISILFLIAFYLIILFTEKYLKKTYLSLGIVSGVYFFGFYIAAFFLSISNYYINIIKSLFLTSNWFLLFYFFLFMIISILFYLAGFLLFIYDIIELKVFRKVL